MDAIDKAVAGDAELSNVINLRGLRAVRNDLKAFEDNLVTASLTIEAKADRRQSELLAAISKLSMGYVITHVDEAEDSIPDNLKTQNQRRFDRAKKHLLEGSIVDAEREFLGLIEDIEALQGQPDSEELLFRSYLNVGASLWEQYRQTESTKWFDKAYSMNQADWRAKRGRAFALVQQRRVDEALALFAEIRKLRPDEWEHVCNEAWLLKNNGRVKDAIELLESKSFGNVHYYAMLSLAYTRAERYGEAEAEARKGLNCGNNSEVAQVALSSAIGFPIIQKRERHETLRFVPSDEERGRLLEAIQHAEGAADTLRRQERLGVLLDVLSNLTAFYPAAGDCGRGESAAHEALRISPDDVIVLKNLWCIQMRLERFDEAASTAGKLQILDDYTDWWVRKSESLLQANRAQDVLDSWESVKNDERLSASSNAIGIVARAFSDRHRTEDGLRLLEQALTHCPADAGLLLDSGHLLEKLGRLDQAQKTFEAAEKNACKENKSQILVCVGLFLHRRHEWLGAMEKFKALGAESVHNPLFSNYLVCLFNEGMFKESVVLAEKAISETSEFVEDFYAIAARCHNLCENFPRARALLEILVAKGGSRLQEHIKLLAWSCWRMDDLPQTYDILQKALRIQPIDLDLLVLMTAACTLLNKHDEAIAYGLCAVESNPDAAGSHAAFVRAMSALPASSKPDQKYVDAYFKSLASLERHGAEVIRRVPVEPDGQAILAIMKTRSEEIQKFEEHFKTQPLPMSVFARHVGRTIFTIWASFLRHSEIKVRMSSGSFEEQQEEIKAAAKAQEVSVDLFAILTLQNLRLLHLLPKIFRRVLVHTSVFDEVITSLREIQSTGASGMLKVVNGKLVKQIPGQEEVKAKVEFLTSIRDFIKSADVELVGLLPETTNAGRAKLLIEACGMAGISPSLVAKEKSVALFSDDVCLRAIGNPDERPSSFCTQAFLRLAVQRHVLNPSEYQDAVINLIEMNYGFVSEDSDVLARCYVLAKGKTTQLALEMIGRINQPFYDQESCLRVLAEFAVFVWRSDGPTATNNREDWLREIWKAISKSNDGDALAMKFISKLAVAAPTQPYIIFGILNNLLYHLPFFQDKKEVIAFLLNEAACTMSRVTRESHPLCVGLPREWLMHAHLNEILIREGLLCLYSMVSDPNAGKKRAARQGAKGATRNKNR